VKALDSAGTATDSAVISLADLAIQPLDFVSLILETHQNGASELEMRVRYAFCQPRGIRDDVNVSIIFADSGSGDDPSVKAFAEIWPLCRLLKKLLGNSRSIQARDFDSSSKSVAFDKNNPGNVDLAAFRTKIVGLYTHSTTLATNVQNASTSLVALKSAAAADQLRLALTKIAETGLSDCFPVSSTGFSQDAIDRLVAQASSVQSRWAAILDAHQKGLVALNAPSTSTDSWISGLVESGKALLGKDFILLPVFKFNDPSDMDACYQSRSHLFDYCHGLGRKLIVEGWQHGVSLVRDRMHTLEMIRLLNDNFSLLSGSSDDPVSMEPIQIPFRSGDNWLGVEFPKGTVVYHDTISLVAHLPVHFDARGSQAGLLVDEWTENIPQSEGVTGIGFNYDQPTSMPAQSLLLAVSPSEVGHWTWDGLVGSILDTFSRAKLRAIEPDQLNQTGLTTLLPAIWAEFSTSGANLSLDYALNLKALATQVTQLNLSTIKAS